jgi:hypothetical protein
MIVFPARKKKTRPRPGNEWANVADDGVQGKQEDDWIFPG